MAKRIAPVGVVSVVLWAACGAMCQNMGQSLPDAPSVQATNQKQNFNVFVEEARSLLKIGTRGDHVGMRRQGEFAASNKALSSRKESNPVFGKYLYPPLLNRQPDDQSSSSGNLMGRAMCAASGILVTRDDSGKVRLNTSYFLRTLTSVAADTASRPYWRRSFGDPFNDFGSTVGNDAGMNMLHEFQPGIQQLMKSYTPGFVSKIEDRLGHH
jgi:hypothetical protein